MALRNAGSRLELAVSVVLIACALFITTVVLVGRRANDYELGIWEISDEDLAAALSRGNVIGAKDAEVQVVEFSDVECPFCAGYVPVLDSLVDRFDGRVSILYRHFPIETVHDHAMAGAVALECAADRGRFEPFYREVFGGQEDIGLRSWTEYAAGAGVADTLAFASCMTSGEMENRVNTDISAARQIGVSATPFVVIGNTGLIGLRPLEELVDHVERYLEDRRR